MFVRNQHTPSGKVSLDGIPDRLCRMLIVTFLAFGIGASVEAETVSIDFPYLARKLPAGLAGPPRESFQGLAAIEIPLLPLESEGSLLAHVIFQDDESRIIQAKWIGGSEETHLVSNLSEGVRACNQRAIRIPCELLRHQGSLVLETDADVQPIRRVNLTWMWPGGVYLASSAHGIECIRSPEEVLTAKDLSDRKSAPLPDSLADGVWKASLQETPEPLDDGLQFEVPVKPPRAAIFRAKLLGFSVSASPVIWVNGQKLGGVSLDVPDLCSPGYFKGEAGEIGFAGWREVAVVIPPGLFQAGVNSIFVEPQKAGYLKEAQLELSFDDEGAPLDLFEIERASPEGTGPSSEEVLADAPIDPKVPSSAPAFFPQSYEP